MSRMERTFQNEDSLPSPPVPDLAQTLSKYLESVRPFLSSAEFLHTEDVVQQFTTGLGKELQRKLQLRAQHHRNWIEKWWEDFAYLESRTPLAALSNIGGIARHFEPKSGSQVEKGALTTWCILKFWQLLRMELHKPEYTRDKMPLSMNQYHRIFSTCRNPGETRDAIECFFKTKSEGKAPTHVVVMNKGRIFKFHVVDNMDNLITLPEIHSHLMHIKNVCDRDTEGPALGILTTEERTTWYRVRDHLIKYDSKNRELLHTIESAVMIISLDDAEPKNLRELAELSLKGDFSNRWADKSYNHIVYKNGITGYNGDHAPLDGIALIVLINFYGKEMKAWEGKWMDNSTVRNLPVPEELIFNISTYAQEAIHGAQSQYKAAADSILLDYLQFKDFGRDFLRPYKIHPDACIQLAIQLTYYRIHGKPAPTYETATARKFYHGRTATVRSCTSEAITWAKSMLDPSVPNGRRMLLFSAALEKHLKLMAEAEEFHGCDRHLFGLYQISQQEGYPTPSIFTDKGFVRSGGGGNYILSTSCVGYSPVTGVVPPMCDNGYGVFYNIMPNEFRFCLTTWKKDKITCPCEFSTKLKQSFWDVRKLLETGKTSTAKL